MAKVSSLVENVKSYLEIRTAADELLKFVSFASLTELLETQSEVAASVTGDPVVDGRISEKLLSSTSSIPYTKLLPSLLMKSRVSQQLQHRQLLLQKVQ